MTNLPNPPTNRQCSPSWIFLVDQLSPIWVHNLHPQNALDGPAVICPVLGPSSVLFNPTHLFLESLPALRAKVPLGPVELVVNEKRTFSSSQHRLYSFHGRSNDMLTLQTKNLWSLLTLFWTRQAHWRHKMLLKRTVGNARLLSRRYSDTSRLLETKSFPAKVSDLLFPLRYQQRIVPTMYQEG